MLFNHLIVSDCDFNVASNRAWLFIVDYAVFALLLRSLLLAIMLQLELTG